MKEAILLDFELFKDFLVGSQFQSALVIVQVIFFALTIIFIFLIIVLLIKDGFAKSTKRKWDWYFTTKEINHRNEWQKAWEKIKRSTKKAKKDQYHLVLFRAEEFLNMALEELGFWGNTLEERLESVGTQRFSNLSEVIRAHSLVNAIREGEPLTLSFEETEQILFIYEDVLRELGIL